MRNSKVVAIQIIHSINLEKAKDEIKDAQQEITMLSQCDSPHIVIKSYGIGEHGGMMPRV